jgi:Na+-translocating ferredoxin:NAD+ oxidoreductase RnfE subunit
MKHVSTYSREAGMIFANGMLYRNPLLVGALGLYPVVAAATGVRSALELSFLFLLISLPTDLVLCLCGMLVPQWFRPGLALLVSAAFYLPAVSVTGLVFPGFESELGMAAGLMICNSAAFSRAEEYAPGHVVLAVAADALGTAAGFSLVVLLTAFLREFWLRGEIRISQAVPERGGAALPFAGFLIVGFLAALVQWIGLRRSDKAQSGRGNA